MIRKLALALAVLPLLTGVALARGAGSGGGGHGGGGGGGWGTGDVGPAAYADWQQQWQAFRAAQTPASKPTPPHG